LGFKKEIINKITGLTTHAAITNININASNEPDPIRISADTLEQLRNLPGVGYIQPTAFKHGLLKTDKENEGILLKGVTSDYDFSFIKKHLVAGDLPKFEAGETSKDILISQVLADKMDLKVDNRILVYFISQHSTYDSLLHDDVVSSEQRSRKLRICGIFKTDFSDFDEKLSIVDLRLVRTLNYWDSTQAGNFEIRFKDFAKADEGVEAIQELLGYNYNVTSVRETYSNIFVWLDKLDINGVIIVVLMILVATINMITALLILILERANMVGMVKTFGMSNTHVRRIFLHLSMRLIGRGMLWGNLAGITLCLLQYYFKLARLDGSTYYVDYVAVELNWTYFVILNLMTFVVCAAMLFLPTLILTRLTPIRTLKFD
jgi:lipoprotein-releasing system permease protein